MNTSVAEAINLYHQEITKDKDNADAIFFIIEFIADREGMNDFEFETFSKLVYDKVKN